MEMEDAGKECQVGRETTTSNLGLGCVDLVSLRSYSTRLRLDYVYGKSRN